MVGFLFSFHGRVRRLHWWLARLGIYIGAILFLIAEFALFYFIFPDTRSGEGGYGNTNSAALTLFTVTVCAILFFGTWAGLAISVKRFHDRDKSGLWLLITLIPLVGPIWFLIECGFLDGTQGANRHGPSPKGIADNEAEVFA
jgi:uncharacterized membrane protein YhaH (DUF805 family)